MFMDTYETIERCPFCFQKRDERTEVVLTLSRTYLVCFHCGGGAEPAYWYPEFAIKARKGFEVVQ